MKKLILLSFTLFLSWTSSGCARNPVTGKRQIVLVSENQEIALGQESDPQVRKEYGVTEAQALQEYVQTMGRKLVRVSHRPNLEWHFTVVNSPVVNAFAIPGGYVYITRGILAYLATEAELAGVMGHEIGHVTARHSVRQITRQELAQIGVGVGSILSPTVGQLGGLAQSGLGLVFLRFSRDDEREADRLGVEYAARAAYDPRQVSSFFDVLGRLSAAGDRETIPGWLSTHPDPPQRVQATRMLAEEWISMLGLTEERMSVNRDPFLHAIEGLVFGNNPREGFTEGARFFHPDLEFQIDFPAGWRVDNSSQAVVAIDPGGGAQLQLTLVTTPSAPTAEDYVRELAAHGLTPQSARSLRIHGYNAVLASYVLQAPQGGILGAVAGFIEYNDHLIQIAGVTPDLGRFRGAIEESIRSFDRVTDQRVLRVQPDRLKIYAAQQGDTLTALAERIRNPRVAADDLAVLNRLAIDQPITPGRLVKIVEPGM
jgi:predicted Zn-dependent protease